MIQHLYPRRLDCENDNRTRQFNHTNLVNSNFPGYFKKKRKKKKKEIKQKKNPEKSKQSRKQLTMTPGTDYRILAVYRSKNIQQREVFPCMSLFNYFLVISMSHLVIQLKIK